ncbi:MAG: hypothetical protein IPG07_08075 [Crocinitomicaceae bacterium]|nr:hypothetical protein [Crocinitomicaceae bacterium]
MKARLFFTLLTISILGSAQDSFKYEVELVPVNVPGLPGLHSYAFAQTDSLWIMIGGRFDGLHARQPFNAFPAANNNDSIFVIDIMNEQYWSASINTLPVSISEQLQSGNMNFHQEADTLYLIGGYAFSVTAADHITFPNLTSVHVSGLANAIINGNNITPFFKQITNPVFAVCGGQLGKMGDLFYLVGGHRFDGRYNPMGGASYVQTYTNEIRMFSINNSGSQLSISNYANLNDPVHLHRRDFNLLPQVFADGSEGYLISSGVFQTAADLPFLYPVEIRESGINGVTSFNQYLSNYHSAKVSLFDSVSNEMHMLFFGGMSQYYYADGALIQDDAVPFVKTISRLSRSADGTYHEYKVSTEMPALKGASAEFIPNSKLAFSNSGIILLSQMDEDTIELGHIYGGIYSPSLNPFSNNQTTTTSADNTIYLVRLIYKDSLIVDEIPGENKCEFELFPNPAKNKFNVQYDLNKETETRYVISSVNGEIIQEGIMLNQIIGTNIAEVKFEKKVAAEMVLVTLIFDDENYCTKRLIME